MKSSGFGVQGCHRLPPLGDLPRLRPELQPLKPMSSLQPTKWKLNKTEQKELDDAVALFLNGLGLSGKAAQDKADEFRKNKEREMKMAKAEKAAEKKMAKATGGSDDNANAANANAANAIKDQDDTAKPSGNTEYLAKIQEAKLAILRTDVFKRIEGEHPLPIQQKDGGVQEFRVGNFWF